MIREARSKAHKDIGAGAGASEYGMLAPAHIPSRPIDLSSIMLNKGIGLWTRREIKL